MSSRTALRCAAGTVAHDGWTAAAWDDQHRSGRAPESARGVGAEGVAHVIEGAHGSSDHADGRRPLRLSNGCPHSTRLLGALLLKLSRSASPAGVWKASRYACFDSNVMIATPS